ncbi:hypothetical protein T439DRAFT_367713 [Meredithblackwellia eburnea MCA 4105]
MGTTRRPGNTAGHHLQQHHPLPKGQACSTCKARKVRCSAGTPACDACMRTARFEGRDPSLVVCRYDGLKCGVKGTGKKSKASSPHPERRKSPSPPQSDPEVIKIETEMAEFEKTIVANLKALPKREASLPPLAPAPSPVPSQNWEQQFQDASAMQVASTSTLGFTPWTSTDVYAQQQMPTNIAYDTKFQQQYPIFSSLTVSSLFSASSYPMPASPDSFHSVSSQDSAEMYFSSPDPIAEEPIPPEHFLSSHHMEDTLSLPLFFPLPDASTVSAFGNGYDAVHLPPPVPMLTPSEVQPQPYWPQDTWELSQSGLDWGVVA